MFLSETNGQISVSLGRHVFLVTLYQDCSSRHDLSTMAARDGAYFPYISINKSSCKKPLARVQCDLTGKLLW